MASQKPQKAVIEQLPTGFDLDRLRALMREAGCTALYAKPLAPNDNNKNQPYFATPGELRVFNILPVRKMHPHQNTAGETSFVADIDFTWLAADGSKYPAPHAKLILYPQYPEVRFSGFLDGANFPAADLMRYDAQHSLPERILFLGVTPARQTFGFVTLARGPVGRQFAALGDLPQVGVFYEVPLIAARDSKALLCHELHRIHDLGWISATTMKRDVHGKWVRVPCRGPRCGGCTLETELGIPPNDDAEPDFAGWEVKQHAVSTFSNIESGVITLFTPEPQGGVYRTKGVIAFLRRYGYADTHGRPDRVNFGGIYRAGVFHPRTNLVLSLNGYDAETGRLIDTTAGIALQERDGTAAAIWPYASLLEHWNRKHAKAVYVPSQHRVHKKTHQYCFNNVVRMAEETDFLWFLKAMASGHIYLDPAIKMEKANTPRPSTKRRNQFRIKASEINRLYRRVCHVDVTAY